MKTKTEIQKEITDQIIAAIKAGSNGTWKRPWAISTIAGLPTRYNGERYQGINLLILAMQGRPNKNWMTFNQAKKIGGNVRKGEKCTTVIFFKPLKVEDKVSGEEKTIPLLRAYNVFNAEQIDGLPEKFYEMRKDQSWNGKKTWEGSHQDSAQYYIECPSVCWNDGGDRAFYSPLTDEITLPHKNQFDSAEDYYGTALHELVHWTGHKDRCDRTYGQLKGDDNYAREELVAEIGATFLAGQLGLEQTVRQDHIQYLEGWLKILKADSSAIFEAASAAQKAVEYLDGWKKAADDDLDERLEDPFASLGYE